MLDRLGDLGRERTGVADARGAAVADDVETELVQRLHQLRALVVVGDDQRTGRERGLHPRRHRQAARDRVPGEQSGRDHHRRVRRVRARRDRGDHDVTVGELEAPAVGQRHRAAACGRAAAAARLRRAGGGASARRARRGRGRIARRERFDRRLVGLGARRADRRRRRCRRASSRRNASNACSKLARAPDSDTRSCGRAGPGQRRLDRREVERDRLVVDGPDVGVVPEALFLRVRLDQRDQIVGPTGRAQVAQRLVVDREDRARRAVLGRHVADRRPVLERHAADAFAVELDELADHTVLAQQLGDGQHEVGRGRADRQRADELDADDARQQHRQRLAEHRGFGLDAADAPTEHAETVHHRRVRVGADERVGIHEAVRRRGTRPARGTRGSPDGRSRGSAGTRATSGTPTAPTAGTCSARGCARTRTRALRTNASATPATSATIEWSMTRSTGMPGSIRRGSPPRSAIASRIAARSTIAGTPVKSCMSTRAGMNCSSRVPASVAARERSASARDVVGADVRAVLVAQQVLEQDAQRVRQRVRVVDDRVEPVEVVRSVADGQTRPGLRSCRASRPQATCASRQPLPPRETAGTPGAVSTGRSRAPIAVDVRHEARRRPRHRRRRARVRHRGVAAHDAERSRRRTAPIPSSSTWPRCGSSTPPGLSLLVQAKQRFESAGPHASSCGGPTPPRRAASSRRRAGRAVRDRPRTELTSSSGRAGSAYRLGSASTSNHTHLPVAVGIDAPALRDAIDEEQPAPGDRLGSVVAQARPGRSCRRTRIPAPSCRRARS